MKLKIEIDSDNDAFVANYREEIARILTKLSTELPEFHVGYRVTLRDSNGNKVGLAKVVS